MVAHACALLLMSGRSIASLVISSQIVPRTLLLMSSRSSSPKVCIPEQTLEVFRPLSARALRTAVHGRSAPWLPPVSRLVAQRYATVAATCFAMKALMCSIMRAVSVSAQPADGRRIRHSRGSSAASADRWRLVHCHDSRPRTAPSSRWIIPLSSEYALKEVWAQPDASPAG
jgi:hypothetical protein